MAERTEIAGEINSLAVHCRPPIMEVEQRASWLRDWCNDLAEFDIDAVRAACREWRQSGAVKFPTPGQLLPLVRKREGGPKPQTADAPWRELTDAEYERLSLSDKIRHHRILAHEARCKAGPMWRNADGGADMKRPLPGHVPLEEMPSTYRQWSAMAENHEAEAQRLSTYLRRAQSQAAE